MRNFLWLIICCLITVIFFYIVPDRTNRNKRSQKPYWEGINTRRILRLVQKETDQQILARVAGEAPDRQVRMAAVERMTDNELLADVARSLGGVASRFKDSDAAAAAVRRITDARVLQGLLVGSKRLSKTTRAYKTALECLQDGTCAANVILKDPDTAGTLLPRVTADGDLRNIASAGALPGAVRAEAWRRLGCEMEADRAILCDPKLPVDQRRAAGNRILALGETEIRAAVRELVEHSAAKKHVGKEFILEAAQKDSSLLREFWPVLRDFLKEPVWADKLIPNITDETDLKKIAMCGDLPGTVRAKAWRRLGCEGEADSAIQGEANRAVLCDPKLPADQREAAGNRILALGETEIRAAVQELVERGDALSSVGADFILEAAQKYPTLLPSLLHEFWPVLRDFLKEPVWADKLIPNITDETDLKKIAMCGDLPGDVRAKAWRRLDCEEEADRAILCDLTCPASQREVAGKRILARGEDETRTAVRELVKHSAAKEHVGKEFISEAAQKDSSLLRKFWPVLRDFLKEPVWADKLIPNITDETDLKKIAMCGDLPGTVRAKAWRRLGCEGEADRAILCDTKLPADQRRAAGDRILALGKKEIRTVVRELVESRTALESVGADFVAEAAQKDPSLLRKFWPGMQAEAHEDNICNHYDVGLSSSDCGHQDTPEKHTDEAHEEKIARFRPYLSE